eukprot:gene24894-32432_t
MSDEIVPEREREIVGTSGAVRDRYRRFFGGFDNSKSIAHSSSTSKFKKQNLHLNRFRINPASLLYASIVPLVCFVLYILDVWIGYTLLYTWISLQVLAVEIIIVLLRDKNGRLSFFAMSKSDLVLCALLLFIYTVITANICLDLIPENSLAQVIVYPNFLTDSQCQQLILAAEDTAAAPTYSSQRGWQTNRHKYYPTTDLPLYTIRRHNISSADGRSSVDLVQWLNRSVISSRIFPILRRQYKLSGRYELSMQDAFLVKYDATSKGLQRHLSTHIDSSQLSFNIALSSPFPSESRSAAAAPTKPNFDEKNKNLRVHNKEFFKKAALTTNASYTDLLPSEGFLSGGTHFTLLDLTYRSERGSLLLHPSRVYHAGMEIDAGKRYILVGFVQVRHPSLWSSLWRKFGAVARCMVLQVANSTVTEPPETVTETAVDDSGVAFVQQASSTLTFDGCRTWLWVYGYELYVVYKEIFLRPSTSIGNIALKVTVFLLCVFLVVLGTSICMLCCLYPGDEDFADSSTDGTTLDRSTNNVSSRKNRAE